MPDETYPDRITAFIKNLSRLDAADRARLKRNAGKALAEAEDVLALFYRLLPYGTPPYQEEAYFLVATLYPLVPSGPAGNLGAALGQVRKRAPKFSKGIDRRIEALIDADESQLAFRLRQAVHFLASNRAGLDWACLLNDLLHWNHPDRFVQKEWARSYFSL
jgi:CRISPR system Cascade subunit CasB